MTISSTTNRVSYAGDGGTTAFSFPHRFLADADLLVILVTDSTGAEATQTLTTDYTVSGAGNASGGTVTMNSAPASGETLVIINDPALKQQSDYVDAAALDAETLEDNVDRLTLIAQRTRVLGERSLRLSDGDISGASMVAPTPEADQYLAWNSTAKALVNVKAPAFDKVENTAKVGSVSDLRVATFPDATTRLWLSGYSGAGTAGAGHLYRDSDDTTTLDDGRTVFVDADGVRWKRPLGDGKNVEERSYAQHPRHLLDVLSMWSDLYMGTDGTGGTDRFPLSITASQSGTTVTTSTALLRKLYVGARIVWDSGEEAIITEVDNSGSSWNDIDTCTVDRSQTVSSSAATIERKNVVGVTYGDSLGNRHSAALGTAMWRALGFGGLVIQANNVDDNFGQQIARVALSAGASDDTSDAHFADYPWGARWAVPSGESITWGFQPKYAIGSPRALRHGFEPDEMKYDTITIVWRREAGAFTVERKRKHDATWESVDTISDASAGSGNFASATYTHGLRHDWEYRLSSTSGTIHPVMSVLKDSTVSGYVHWNLSRGGENIEDFDQLSSAELTELCQLVGQPTFRTIIAADVGGGSTDTAVYKAILDNDRSLWSASAPVMDHIWFTTWIADSNEKPQRAWNNAVIDIGIENDDSVISFEKLFGDFATQGSKLGWIDDGVHPSAKGEVVIAHRLFRALGLADFPTIREGRDVYAREVEAATLKTLGRDVGERIGAVERRPFAIERGSKWSNNARLIADSALGSAIGTGDFTYSIHLTVPDSSISSLYIGSASTDTSSLITNSAVYFRLDTNDLRIDLTDSGGNVIKYRLNYVRSVLAGETGILTVRTDVANKRFDVFWNGMPFYPVAETIEGDTTSPLGTWSGVGTEFGIAQNGTIAENTDMFHAGFWRSRLTDAQILAIAEADEPVDTSPDFWWDMREGIGRVVQDQSGNGRDAINQGSNPNQYAIGSEPTWKHPKRGVLGLPWEADLDAVSQLKAGDTVVVSQSGDRDWPLPDSSEVGDVLRMTVNTSATIKITQAAGQQIKSGASATTAGTGGSLTVPDATSVMLRCVSGGTGSVWALEDHTGAALTFT